MLETTVLNLIFAHIGLLQKTKESNVFLNTEMLVFLYISPVIMFNTILVMSVLYFYHTQQEVVTLLLGEEADVTIKNAEGLLAKNLARTESIKRLIEGTISCCFLLNIMKIL